MRDPTMPESIFSKGENFEDQANRLKETPKVARMARFYAEVVVVSWGYADHADTGYSSVGIPIEGTDVVHRTELTRDEALELEPKVKAVLTTYCEGEEDIVIWLFSLAHDQLVREVEGDTSRQPN